MNKKELITLRREIDAVDKVILTALAKRAKLSKVIGKYKFERGMQALDKARQKQLIRSRVTMAKAMRISTKLANEIFSRIHKNSVAIQKKLRK